MERTFKPSLILDFNSIVILKLNVSPTYVKHVTFNPDWIWQMNSNAGNEFRSLCSSGC